MKFVIEIELELPVDEEGLTNEGWEIASNFQNAIDKLRDDYSWKEITHVGMPKRKQNGSVCPNCGLFGSLPCGCLEG